LIKLLNLLKKSEVRVFPYRVLVDRKDVLKEEIIRIKTRIYETKDPRMTDILKNQLQEAQELLMMVNKELTYFMRTNTNK
jgi:hypothetical protein